jgi:hypothetical protein
MNVHRKKSTNESQGKPEQKFDAAYETICKIIVFKESSRNFILVFPFNKTGKKCKNHLRMYIKQGTGLIL